MMANKTAIISGITGQDGAYLAQLLLKNNYNVIGLTRDCNDASIKGLDYLKITDGFPSYAVSKIVSGKRYLYVAGNAMGNIYLM